MLAGGDGPPTAGSPGVLVDPSPRSARAFWARRETGQAALNLPRPRTPVGSAAAEQPQSNGAAGPQPAVHASDLVNAGASVGCLKLQDHMPGATRGCRSASVSCIQAQSRVPRARLPRRRRRRSATGSATPCSAPGSPTGLAARSLPRRTSGTGCRPSPSSGRLRRRLRRTPSAPAAVLRPGRARQRRRPQMQRKLVNTSVMLLLHSLQKHGKLQNTGLFKPTEQDES